MITPVWSTLLGALAGGALATTTAGGVDLPVAQGMFMGAGAGLQAGGIADTVARVIRQKRFRERLGDLPNATAKDVKKLEKAFRYLNIPIYKQVGGEPYDNACYTTGGMRGGKWKDIKTGKVTDKPANHAVFIGANFNKLPVLAHELGHGHDFITAKRWYHKPWLPALLSLGTVGGSVAAMIGGASGIADAVGSEWEGRERSIAPALTAGAGIGLALICAGMRQSITLKNERAASDKAIMVLKNMATQEKLDKYRKMLQAAYGTYEPIQVTGSPTFGSGEYAALHA